MASSSPATSFSELLPQLQAVFAPVAAAPNPFSAFAQALYQQAYPGVISWSRPLFILVAVLASFNLIATIVTLVIRYRQEGLSIAKLREHRGSRYIALNAINVFLIGNIVTCMAWIAYPILHIGYYDQPGHAYMDLGWATMMWAAPYVQLFLASVGVLYGTLVASSPIAYHSLSDGDLRAVRPPLAFLPCWFLNGFIFAVPVITIIAVGVPAGKLLGSTNALEMYGLVVWSMIQQNAAAYASTGVSVQSQASLLKAFAELKALDGDAESKWLPVFGTWAFFIGCASVLAIMTFFAVRSVTKARLAVVQSQHIQSFDDGVAELNVKSPRRMDRKARAAMRQAKFDHYNLCFQFGSAAVLLLISFGLLLFDCIKGWEVHTNPVMLALALLIIMLSYFAQSTPSVGLIMYRAIRGRNMAGVAVEPTASTSQIGTHSRHASGDSGYAGEKTNLAVNDRGAIVVNALSKNAYPVAPSVMHQIQIEQIIHTEEEVTTHMPPHSRADSSADGSDLGEKRNSKYSQAESYTSGYGRAL